MVSGCSYRGLFPLECEYLTRKQTSITPNTRSTRGGVRRQRFNTSTFDRPISCPNVLEVAHARASPDTSGLTAHEAHWSSRNRPREQCPFYFCWGERRAFSLCDCSAHVLRLSTPYDRIQAGVGCRRHHHLASEAVPYCYGPCHRDGCCSCCCRWGVIELTQWARFATRASRIGRRVICRKWTASSYRHVTEGERRKRERRLPRVLR